MNVASYVLSFCKCPDKTKDPFEFEYDPDTVEVLRQIYNETNKKLEKMGLYGTDYYIKRVEQLEAKVKRLEKKLKANKVKQDIGWEE